MPTTGAVSAVSVGTGEEQPIDVGQLRPAGIRLNRRLVVGEADAQRHASEELVLRIQPHRERITPSFGLDGAQLGVVEEIDPQPLVGAPGGQVEVGAERQPRQRKDGRAKAERVRQGQRGLDGPIDQARAAPPPALPALVKTAAPSKFSLITLR